MNGTIIREVEQVVRQALACEEDALLLPATPIVELGAEQLDLGDICYRLKIPYANYSAAGRLTEAYAKDMSTIANKLKPRSIRKEHFLELASLTTTKDLLDRLLLDDLIYMTNFHRRKSA